MLRTLVPVSVRAAGDGAPNNQVSAMIAELPIGIADPLERLASMRAQMDRSRHPARPRPTQTLTALADLTPPSLLALGLRAVGGDRHASSRSAPSTRSPRTSAARSTRCTPPGRQMVAYQPFVPIGQGVRIGVAILSYDGGVSFGVTGDYDTVPDVARLCRSIEAGSTTRTVRLAARPGRGSDVVLWPRTGPRPMIEP